MTKEEHTEKLTRAIKLFIRTDRIHRATIESQLNKLGLHRTQHIILMYLSGCDLPPSQADLAKAFEISPAAITVTLQKLERGGLIDRIPQEGNLRAKSIFITEAGRQMIAKTNELFQAVDAAMCAGIGEEEVDSFVNLLVRMQQNLRAFSPEVKDLPLLPKRKRPRKE
jgi:DNA-binding MarR family transcriptional regulator